MKWIYFIVVVFLISIVWLVYEIHAVDSKYSRLIEDESHRLLLVRKATANANRRHILLFHTAHTSDTSRRAKLIHEMKQIDQANSIIYDSLLNVSSGAPQLTHAVNNVIEARKRYHIIESQYTHEILSSPKSLINEQIEQQLDSVFVNYQNSISNLFMAKDNYILSLSDQFTSETRTTSSVIGAFLALPVIVVLLLTGTLMMLVHRLVSPFRSEPK